VRSIKSSRAWTSTCSQTSSGARCSSIKRRLKVNSVSEAEGKPTSISLKPVFTKALEKVELLADVHGHGERLVARRASPRCTSAAPASGRGWAMPVGQRHR